MQLFCQVWCFIICEIPATKEVILHEIVLPVPSGNFIINLNENQTYNLYLIVFLVHSNEMKIARQDYVNVGENNDVLVSHQGHIETSSDVVTGPNILYLIYSFTIREWIDKKKGIIASNIKH